MKKLKMQIGFYLYSTKDIGLISFADKYKNEIIKYLDKLNLYYLDLTEIIDSSNILNYAPNGPHL